MAAIAYPGLVMAAITDPPGSLKGAYIVGIGYCVTVQVQ